ncbi:MAG: ASKHA domain-containing protein, partial [Anaerolineae bacterium]|nr:ASKHA domain-containing protein [Anaerolineae bacterium]
MLHLIDFQPIGRRGPCPEDGTLLDAARRLGVDLTAVCGGHGSCGRCKVQLIAGELTAVTPGEEARLTRTELAQGYRLACLARPLSDCRIHVPVESLTAPQRTQVEGLETPVAAEPAVAFGLVEIPVPTLDDLRGDDQRLCEAIAAATGAPAALTDLEVARHASVELRRLHWRARVTLRGREVIHVAAADAPWLGLAVDIGTTKIAAYLVDLTTGRTMAAAGAMNPQIAYGEDVIARLMYAGKGPEEAAALQALLADGLNRLAADLCSEVGARPSDIVDAVVVGNTAIHHLFLRLPVTQLAAAPYVPAVRAAVDVKAREVGLKLAPGAYVHLLPNIAGYVGADHVAMLLATGVADATDTVLALDIGTNTEICLAHRGRLTSLSCASGPAFEGAHITFGMRAAPGAIERVRIADGRVEYKTIGDAPPAGLCGSGILDAMAQLRLAGLLDQRGMLSGPGVRVIEKDPAFVIADAAATGNGRPIFVTQHDIRELQLAKGAIRCGIETLLQHAGIGPAALDRVIIAGAFGTYIDVDSALTIGLLPPVPRERLTQVGNAAGTG